MTLTQEGISQLEDTRDLLPYADRGRPKQSKVHGKGCARFQLSQLHRWKARAESSDGGFKRKLPNVSMV